MDKKYITATISTVIIVPMLIIGWKNIQNVWSAPEKIESITKKVVIQESIQDQLSKLVVEQQARLDKAEAVNTLQIQAMRDANQSTKEQLQLIAELKKKR